MLQAVKPVTFGAAVTMRPPSPPSIVRSVLAALLLRLFAPARGRPPTRPPRLPPPPPPPPTSAEEAAAAAATASMAPWERYHLDPPPPGGTPPAQRVLNWAILLLTPAGLAWEWRSGNVRGPGSVVGQGVAAGATPSATHGQVDGLRGDAGWGAGADDNAQRWP